MHAYSGNINNPEEAAQSITDEVVALQRHFRLQIPIIVSEAAVNRGNDPDYKARRRPLGTAEAVQGAGIHGLFGRRRLGPGQGQKS